MPPRIKDCALAAMASTALLTLGAGAQTASVPDASVIAASRLDDLPHTDISNGMVSARIYLPGENGFYRGTRFDRSGVVVHATYKGHDYGRYWFSSYSPYVHDFAWRDHQVTVSPASGAAGPAEEFDVIGFDDAKMGGKFLKIGVGVLERTTEKYDHVLSYPVLNEGGRTTKATRNSVRFTQRLSDKDTGYGYFYVKTVRMMPGKPEMVIEHRLENTGKKDLVTLVYCHNFLSLSPGNANVELTAPFRLVPGRPLDPDVAEVNANSLRYLRPVREGESVTTPFTGFGSATGDYDFKVLNTKTGFGERIRADQPLAQINFWSIRTIFSWEPYIAISLKPGESKSWTYTYDYFGPEGG